MNKLKLIKKQLQNQKQWISYKKKFKHKQMRMVFSKIALVIDPKIDEKLLYQTELELMQAEKTPAMFINSFKLLEKRGEFVCDWNLFGRLMWYIYQTSTYWSDSKRDVPNIFNSHNYIEINQLKRDLYQAWINSIDKSYAKFNDVIIQIARLVL